jgi:RimJ/RimL family protein N-acetyltransferase
MTLRLRSVRPEDSSLIYAWQEDPSTRKYFRDSSVPSREEHEAWYRQRLKADPLNFWLAEDIDIPDPAGFIRLEREPKGLFVSIVVHPFLRGHGYGGRMLVALRQEVPDEDLYALVDERNMASIKTFEKAGYCQLDDGMFVSWRGEK